MTARRLTLGAALLVLAAWLLLTMGAGQLLSDGRHASLSHAAGQGFGWPWLLAAVFALAVAWRFGPDATGLGAPSPLSSIRLVWLPLSYVVLMLTVDLLIGTPAPAIMLVVAVNMLLVGLSEELMFRSILFRGMLARFHIWPAVLLSSLLFGLVHTLNVFATGQLQPALMQALAAFMQGLAYQAIRIRTGSVWPMVVVHGLWDFSLVLPGLRHPEGELAVQPDLLPLLVALPVFLYGLFLLRHLDRDYAHWSDAAPVPHAHGGGQ